MNDNNRNLMLAIALSAAVLFGWQYFVAMPAMKADQAKQALIAKEHKQAAPAARHPFLAQRPHNCREARLWRSAARASRSTHRQSTAR